MRSERVLTNLTCSQSCTYCTSRDASDARAFVAAAAVRARIDQALASGAAEVVLTGGEPALRRDLAALVAYAREKGARTVVLESNATAIDAALARALAAAGLTVARVNLAGPDPRLDEVTRDPGGFARTVAGIVALRDAGLRLDFACALVHSTRAFAAEVPAAIARILGDRTRESAAGGTRASQGGAGTLWISVPTQSPSPGEVLSFEDSVPVIVAVERAARSLGIAVKLAPGSGPPPCAFPERGRPSHLFSMTPGGRHRPDHAEIPACRDCQVQDRCPGVARETLARFGVPAVTPVRDDRARRRLSLISTVEEQVARELVTPNRYRDAHERDMDEDIIRINFHCNQSCRFCFVSTHLPEAGDAAVRAAILDAARRGVKITLSGGEPTLSPRLVEYVRLAKAHSKMPVLLQTNAIRLDDAKLATELFEAGLDEAFISLHGTTAELSDAVTSAPGTFVRSVAGIDNLYRTGVRIVLNFVICKTNASNLPEYVRFVAARWPRTFVNVSFVAPSTDVVPREEEFIPRYTDVLPYIEAGLAEAARLGIEMGGFESMCGVPLCLVPASIDGYFRLAEIPPGFDKGEFVKTETCAACALEAGCYGIRRGYAELHGAGELRAVQGDGGRS
jgi:MoaA/NifB/PqqE/SkfB family radical SAM enzyme